MRRDVDFPTFAAENCADRLSRISVDSDGEFDLTARARHSLSKLPTKTIHHFSRHVAEPVLAQ